MRLRNWKFWLVIMIIAAGVECVNAQTYRINSEVHKYFTEFMIMAEEEGYDLSYVYEGNILIDISEKSFRNYSVGTHHDNLVRVVISRKIWEVADDRMRRQIVFHELGHDILNLEHSHNGLMNPVFYDYEKPNPRRTLRRVLKNERS